MSIEIKTYTCGSCGTDDITIPYLNVESEIHTNYEDYLVHRYGDVTFQKSTSKNMDKLWSYFYKYENYPEYYLGIAKRVAICKCPLTGKEEMFNGDRCLSIENPKIYSTITVTVKIKKRVYRRDFIFLGWAKTPIHEWIMKRGTNLMIDQKFIDGLLPEDKRYLKMNC
jgi:hypothetical protein